MKNYHYYLKQEIYPHQAGSKRFVSMRWHPEQPMTLYVIGEGELAPRTGPNSQTTFRFAPSHGTPTLLTYRCPTTLEPSRSSTARSSS